MKQPRLFTHLALAILFGLTCPPVLATSQPIAENPAQLRIAAMDAMLRGDSRTCLDLYESTIEAAQKHYGENSSFLFEIYYEAGVIALEQDQFNKAEDYLNRALKLNPYSAMVKIKLSELYDKRERPNDAHALLNDAINLDPHAALPRYRMIRWIAANSSNPVERSLASQDSLKLSLLKGTSPNFSQPGPGKTAPKPVKSTPLAPVKPQVKPEVKPKLEAETKAKEEARARTEAKARAEAKAKTEAKARSEVKAKAEAKARAEAKAKAEAKARAEVKAKSEAKAKAEVKPKPETKPEVKPRVEVKPAVKPETKPKAQVKPTKSKPEAASAPNTNVIPNAPQMYAPAYQPTVFPFQQNRPKPKPGFTVPPPPNMLPMPPMGVMPPPQATYAPPKAVSKPVTTKPKPKVEGPKVEVKSEPPAEEKAPPMVSPSDADPEFILDWGGVKPTKKGRGGR